MAFSVTLMKASSYLSFLINLYFLLRAGISFFPLLMYLQRRLHFPAWTSEINLRIVLKHGVVAFSSILEDTEDTYFHLKMISSTNTGLLMVEASSFRNSSVFEVSP
ncbi:hypothetical protein F4801DRAFT_18229 [Xylaria longipes]|nr:hypothetical protein F4801DRAFT_18229 [Xylaria longipes]